MTYRNIDLMSSSLEQLGGADNNRLLIDCEKLAKVDAGGMRFLNIWLQCIRLQGLEPKLVNLSVNLHKAFQASGVRECSAKKNRLTPQRKNQHHYYLLQEGVPE